MKSARETYIRLSTVYYQIRDETRLPPLVLKDVSQEYMSYLLERGPAGSIDEYITLDRAVNGPFSIRSYEKVRLAHDGKLSTTETQMRSMNGHPGVQISNPYEARNPYDSEFDIQGLQPSNIIQDE